MSIRKLLVSAAVLLLALAPTAMAQDTTNPPAGGDGGETPDVTPTPDEQPVTSDNDGFNPLWLVIGLVVLVLLIALIAALSRREPAVVERETVIDRDNRLPP